MQRTKFWAVALAALIGLGALSLPQTAEAGRGWGPGPVGAGLIGLGVGAAIGSALASPVYVVPPPPPVYVGPPPPIVYSPAAYGPPPWTPEWYGYCAQRYRSFNARTGMFIGYDGFQYFCQ